MRQLQCTHAPDLSSDSDHKQPTESVRCVNTMQITLTTLSEKHSTHTHTSPTHLCSPLGRCKCSRPLCGRTPLHSGKGWSSTGWSRSRSSRQWSPRGSDSADPRWGGWAGTRWRARRWRGRSCWSAGPRCTSCSSGTAHGDTRCRQMGEPEVMERKRKRRGMISFIMGR